MNGIDFDNVRSVGRNAVLKTQLVRNARRGGMCKEEECDESCSSVSVITGLLFMHSTGEQFFLSDWFATDASLERIC